MVSDAFSVVFAGIELARRIEQAERSLIREAAQATAARTQAPTICSIAGGLAVWAAPKSPFNKVVGAGMGDRLAIGELRAELDTAEQMFEQHANPTQFELATMADPYLAEHLTRHGYSLTGFENVLALPLSPTRNASQVAGIDVRQVDLNDPHAGDTWLRVDVEASATADTAGIAPHEELEQDDIASAVRAMSSTSGFVAALATINGEPAGSGSLRVHDRVAQLCGAATLPTFRRRGVQSALLAARLAWATMNGCDLAVVTVQPGSTSQQNVQRIGFQLVYARAILVKAS